LRTSGYGLEGRHEFRVNGQTQALSPQKVRKDVSADGADQTRQLCRSKHDPTSEKPLNDILLLIFEGRRRRPSEAKGLADQD
jgi:hypothetical protein